MKEINENNYIGRNAKIGRLTEWKGTITMTSYKVDRPMKKAKVTGASKKSITINMN